MRKDGKLNSQWTENPALKAVDLILCRNVFIYFQYEAIAAILKQFYATLSPGGYLVTGHSELQGQDMEQFKLLLFPESIVYQRPATAQSTSTPSSQIKIPSSFRATPKNVEEKTISAVLPLPLQSIRSDIPVFEPAIPRPRSLGQIKADFKMNPHREEKSEDLLEQARNLLHQGRYTAVLATTERLLEQDLDCDEVYYLRAQAYANQGDLLQAIAACQASIRQNSDFLEPLYLLAQIAEEQQNPQQAKGILKKILYLDPASIAAYIDLGTLYMNEGEQVRAQKMLQRAWELLQPLAPEQQVQYRGSVSVQSLESHLEMLLKHSKD
jgi:chemotaxis protein methyltransferase CheR